jgi:hypothetical protein
VLFCDLANSGRFELGRVLYTLGYSYYFLGALVRALKGAAQVEAIGEATEDRRLQTNGTALKEWAAELTVDLS